MELSHVPVNSATLYIPALLLTAGITTAATGPAACTPDPATSRVRGQAAQVEPCPAPKLEGFSTGRLNLLCQDPPRAYS